MLIRIISLVILFVVINTSSAISAEEDTFLLPKSKPNTLQPKIIEKKNLTNKDILLPKDKPSKKNTKIVKILNKGFVKKNIASE